MGDTWWSTAPVRHLANGQLRKQAKAPHGVSSQQCCRCCKLWHLSLLIHVCVWFTVNQNVARILQVGSKKPQLHALALKVFSLSLQHHIRLEPEWIPRELKGIGSVYKRHPVTKFEHGNHGASKRKFNHITVY